MPRDLQPVLTSHGLVTLADCCKLDGAMMVCLSTPSPSFTATHHLLLPYSLTHSARHEVIPHWRLHDLLPYIRVSLSLSLSLSLCVCLFVRECGLSCALVMRGVDVGSLVLLTSLTNCCGHTPRSTTYRMRAGLKRLGIEGGCFGRSRLSTASPVQS
jgi:hypothetical protein